MICTLYALPKTCPKKRVHCAMSHSSKHSGLLGRIHGGFSFIAALPPSAKHRLTKEGKKPSLAAAFSPSTH